jgi:hypothetical protein
VKNNFTLSFLLAASGLFAQTAEKKIHCRAIADSVSVEGVNVVNLVNEKAAVTDQNGEFWILAKAEDLLVLSAVNFEYKRKLIEEEDLKSELVIIKLIPKVTNIKEVVVNEYAHINTEALGIIPKGMKRYTPAERRFRSSQSGPVDIIVNLINGTTSRRKKELVIEKKERQLSRVAVLYDQKYYVETLKIPQEYIPGFQYYLIEDTAFLAAVNAKNKTMTMFLVTKLATDYLELIKAEETR